MRPPRADRRRSALNSFSHPGFRGAVAPLLRLEAGFKGANGIFIDYMSRNARSKHPMPASKPVQNRGPQTLVNLRASFLKLKRMRWLLADQASRRRSGGGLAAASALQVPSAGRRWPSRSPSERPVGLIGSSLEGWAQHSPQVGKKTLRSYKAAPLPLFCGKVSGRVVLGPSPQSSARAWGMGTKKARAREDASDEGDGETFLPFLSLFRRVALKGAWPALASMAASTSEACPAAASALWKRNWNVRVRAGQRWRHPAEGDPHAGGRRRTAPGLGDDREGPKRPKQRLFWEDKLLPLPIPSSRSG